MTDETEHAIGPETIAEATAAPTPDEPPAPDPAPPEAAPPEPPTHEAELHAMKLGFSRRAAEREYGAETLAKVHDWALAKAAAEPDFNAAMFASGDPYEDAVQAWRREQVLASFSHADLADLEAFRAWQAAQAAGRQSPSPAPAAASPPRSLATAPGNGAAGMALAATGEGAAFTSAFT